MKRSFGIILTLSVAVNMACTPVWAGDASNVLPSTVEEKVGAGAADAVQNRKNLEQIISLAKAKLTIPADYTEFSSNTSNYGGKTTWSLQWSNNRKESSRSGGSLEVGMDDRGNILYYNHYKYNRDMEYRRRLPSISEKQALETAKKFIYYVNPEMVDQVALDEGTYDRVVEYEGNYRFTFYRRYKGIPFYENNISLVVNGTSGEVINFNRNWLEDVQFPKADQAISLQAANKAFQDKIGLELKYRRTYGDENIKTYLEYSSVSTNLGSAIDAITGEKISDRTGYEMSDEMRYKYLMYGKEQASEYIGGTQLTDQEASEVTRMESLIPVQELEKKVKGMAELGFSDEYTLNHYFISKNGNNASDYTIRMDFVKPLSEKDLAGENIPEEKIKVMIAAGEMGRNVNVTLNARTGELLALNSYGIAMNNNTSTSIDINELQKKAESFLSRYKPEKLSQLELQEATGNSRMFIERYGYYNSNNSNTVVYTRKVKGIPFEDNWIVMSFDNSSGALLYYNEVWNECEFVSADGVIGVDRAYGELFSQSSLQLKYITTPASNGNANEQMKKEIPLQEVSLVYALDGKKPACIDAKSGRLMKSINAEPYQEKSALIFKDTDQHPAREQIKALADGGILPAENSFRPNDRILQKEYLLLVAKVRGAYPVNNTVGPLQQKELDALYRMLLDEGILEEEERNPDGTVTREEAVKYLLRSVGYKKFAELEDLFACTYVDKNDINPKLLGYVAIAKSLGIISGTNGYFEPKKEITRADAAVILYNYLSH